MTEIIDVIDENDNVIGQAPYSDIYSKKLPHRIVHLFIFNDAGEMALQLRSKHKSFCPGAWSTSVGGHVQSGETYEAAILRESMEEVGIVPLVKFLSIDRYQNTIERGGQLKFLGTFTANYNGSFKINLEEVEKCEFFSLKEIKQMIARGEKFHPELVFLIKKYF